MATKNPITAVKPKSVSELFSNPARWIKHHAEKEKTIKGKKVTCYCLSGAIEHIYGTSTEKADRAFDRTNKAISAYELGKIAPYNVDIPDWNDKRARTVVDVQRIAAIAKI